MTSKSRWVIRPARLLAVFMLVATTGRVQANEPGPWEIDAQGSHIRFAAKLFGSKIRGKFAEFQADIRIDPERLAHSRVTVTVDPASINTRNSERDDELSKESWFNVKAFPSARFESLVIERTAEGFQTVGTLTILDTTKELRLPFELEIRTLANGSRFGTLRGKTTLKRTEFGLGKGKWGKTSVVRDDVEVEVEVSGTLPSS